MQADIPDFISGNENDDSRPAASWGAVDLTSALSFHGLDRRRLTVVLRKSTKGPPSAM
jgi:hypothetical protein